MQSPGAGAEGDITPRRVFIELHAAIPDAGPAVDALFAIESRDPAGARGDRLAGAHLDAHLGDTALAEIRVDETYVVRVAGGRLHLAAHEERVLVRYQQLAVVRTGRPADTVHQGVVAAHAARAAVLHDLRQFGGGNLLAVILFGAGHQLGLAAERVLAIGEARDGHPQQSGDHAAVEAVARLLGDFALLLHPTGAPPRHVGGVEVFLGERLARLQQFRHRFGELDAGGPGFVDAAAGQHVGAAGAFADARVALAHQERLAAKARFLQRFGAPTAQFGSLQIPPEVRVQHVVLQVAVRGTDRTPEPGRDEESHRGDAAGMHVEEAEDLRLRIAEGVKDRAGFEGGDPWGNLGQIHQHLHADRPLALVVDLPRSEEH